MADKLKYKRVLLKLSGESFAKPGERGICMDEVVHIATQVKKAGEMGCQIAIVIGGGNILRGSQFKQTQAIVNEATAHYMGMLGTVINGLALQDGLESIGCDTRLMSAIQMDGVCEPYIRRRAIRHLEKGRVVIIGGGTGNPYFTTDTAAALRAMEIDADLLIKATKVDGVYAEDPHENPDAERFDHLTYMQALEMRVGVMDATAISLCMENDLPIIVLNLWQPHSLERAVLGETIGTLISQ